MNYNLASAALAAATAALVVACILDDASSAWALPLTVLAALASVLAALKVIAGRFWLVMEHIDAQSQRILSQLPSDIHAMQVVMGRFPQCTMLQTSFSIRFANLKGIVDLLDQEQPKTIVEFGSGTSTICIAAWLSEQGIGRLHSFDHDPEWAERTRLELARHGLSEFASVTTAPLLKRSGTQDLPWYDVDFTALELAPIDFIVVDGPPSGAAELEVSRSPAAEVLASRMSPHCTLVLDDANRPGEQKVAAQWRKLLSDFSHYTIPTATGLAVLSRRSSAPTSELAKSQPLHV